MGADRHLEDTDVEPALEIERPPGGGPIRLGSYIWRHRRGLYLGAPLLVATTFLAMAIPWLARLAVDAIGAGRADRLPRLALSIVLAAAAAMVTRVASRILIFDSGRRIEYDIRRDLFSHILALAPSYHRGHAIGDLTSRLTNDLAHVRILLSLGMANGVNAAVTYAVGLSLMLAIDWRLTLIALAPMPAVLLIARRFAARLYSGTRETQALLSRMSTVAQENLSGMSVVHCFGREEAQVAAFARTADEYYAAQKRLIYATDGMFPFMGMLGGLATLIVLYYGGAGVIGGRLSLGEFVAFNGYLALLQWPTMAMGWILAMVQRGRASLSRISEIMAAAPTIRDDDPEAVGPIRGDIEFRGMVFDYGGRRVLDDVSLFIPAGQVLAVVGRTGAGKSTLAAMIPRLLEIPPGRLFIDGVDATRVPLAALRSAVGYAPQDPAFFSTTIADAVAFSPAADGRPESIAAVARAAGLAGDIERMPAGLGTAIGERGVKLSGGQRQRLAIARALAARPRILVLDDVFSSVDADTEARVLAGLRDHLAGRTTIIVSHRLAAARLADRVAVIDRGRLVEVGTHAELLEKGGVYAELDRAGRLAAELERMSA